MRELNKIFIMNFSSKNIDKAINNQPKLGPEYFHPPSWQDTPDIGIGKAKKRQQLHIEMKEKKQEGKKKIKNTSWVLHLPADNICPFQITFLFDFLVCLIVIVIIVVVTTTGNNIIIAFFINVIDCSENPWTSTRA
jgi:hypothetical protein